MARSAVIIIENDAVALIRREINGQVHYLFPGGTVDENETPEQTAEREALEELGVNVALDRLAAEITYHGTVQYHYLAHIVGGRFGTGLGDEVTGKSDQAEGSYLPVWVPVCKLLDQPAYPRSICEQIVLAETEGWPADVIKLEDTGRARAD